MIDEYKYLSAKPDSPTLLNEVLSKETVDPKEVNYVFQDCFYQISAFAENQNYVEEIPFLEGIVSILSKFKDLDFTNLYQINIFKIFYDFINFFYENNYIESSTLITNVIKLMFRHLGTIFAEDFSSTPLCQFFVNNLNMPIFDLFSILIGESEKVNQNLSNFGLLDKIPNDDSIRKSKFLLFSNYVLKCDLTEDFINCKFVVNECIDHIFDEEDDECYTYRILAINRSIERSKEIRDILIQHDIIGFINQTIINEQKNQRIFNCLQILEIITFNPSDFCKEKLSENLSLSDLLQKLTISDDVEIGKKVWNCLINLLSYDNEHIFNYDQYIECQLPQFIINTLELNGSFKMKQSSLICLSNFLLSFNVPISFIFNDEMLNVIVLSFFDFSFISSKVDIDKDIFLCICKIIKSLIDDNKVIYFEEIDEYLRRVENENEFDQFINEKCGNLLTFLEQKIDETQ